MNDSSTTDRPSPVRLALMLAVGFGSLVAMIFWPAGRLDWLDGWVLFGAMTLGWLVNYLVVRAKNPDLLGHRTKAGVGTERWDFVILGLLRIALLGSIIVAGLDAVRYEWTTIGPWRWAVGAPLLVVGYAIVISAMSTNQHFEGTVRIQEERDHRVVDTGPYRVVRHPGYVGFACIMATIPLFLGSWWSGACYAASVVVLVVRTALEDRKLRRELPGYEAYASRVRWRLVPYVW